MKNKNNLSRWLTPLIVCALLTSAAVWYDLSYNGGRLVYPMDSYAFQPTDMPMLTALALDFLCALYLMVLLFHAVLAQRQQVRETQHTRRLSPKFGLLGFLGFLGFAGFWSCPAINDITPFAFFLFFGFFGFFFEGKMSDTLMDERFRENELRAQLLAYRIGFAVIVLLLIGTGMGSRFAPEIIAPVMMGGVALAIALTMFLSEYLLYRYDHGGALESGEGEE